MTENLLAGETSPYLLQHKDNPVHWRPWGPAALAEAKQSGKPILLSVGYAACHWCHVMAHESFETDTIADVMNDLFVNIKVDREERPDIDSIYQNALALLGQQGGWPLTMFLTPDGEPFWGGTYFPPEPRYGRPGFVTVLQRISEVFHGDKELLEKNRAGLLDGLKGLQADGGSGRPLAAVLDKAAESFLGHMDLDRGGLQGAPKFPQCGLFELLWRAYLRTGEAPYRDAVTVTLDNICQGGIYDHLGGGFARYSTDARWLAPHFEKMLYDNAQLVRLLTLAWQETGAALYRQRIEETVDWVLREMVAEGGGFAAAQDADSEGVEGKFYTWSQAEIEEILGDRAAAFGAVYDVSAHGNWEGVTILNRLGTMEPLPEAEESARAEDRAKLFAVRETRIKPLWDDKVLADWNGLMIAALADAAFVFDRPDWREAAVAAYDFVTSAMTTEDGRLMHTARAGKVQHTGMLDDYAQMIRAALALYETSGGEPEYLDQAKSWAEAVEAHFQSASGYYLTADDAEALIIRAKHAQDSATPSANGTMIENLARLAYLTGEATYRDRAEAALTAFSGGLARNLFGLITYLNAFDFAENAVQVVIAGPERDGFIATVKAISLPNGVLFPSADSAALSAAHPAAGKGPVNGETAAYVCHGMACSLPQTDRESFKTTLMVARSGSEGV